MATGFYVKRGDKEQGPFSSEDLKKFAASGKIKKTDKIRKENSEKYYPAESVKGLFDAPAQKKKKPAKKAKEEYAVVEVIDDGDASDFDTYGDDDFGDDGEFDDVEFADDYDDFDEVEEYEPQPARKRRSRGPTAPPPARRGAKGKKKSSAGKPKKKRPAKDDDDEDEEEDGPWMNIFYGVICVAAGIFLFIALGEEGPEDWGRRGGLIKLVLQLVYKLGGRWLVLGIMILFGCVLFWAAFEQFKKQRG
jgi:hypothetical protein